MSHAPTGPSTGNVRVGGQDRMRYATPYNNENGDFHASPIPEQGSPYDADHDSPDGKDRLIVPRIVGEFTHTWVLYSLSELCHFHRPSATRVSSNHGNGGGEYRTCF